MVPRHENKSIENPHATSAMHLAAPLMYDGGWRPIAEEEANEMRSAGQQLSDRARAAPRDDFADGRCAQQQTTRILEFFQGLQLL
jgi:hypothetical protein